MKPYIINRNSWHYKLASAGKYWDVLGEPTDFCSYWRIVMFGLFQYFILGLFILLLVSFIAASFYVNPVPTTIGVVTIFSIIFGVFGFHKLFVFLKENKRQHDYDVSFNRKQEGLLSMKYRSWKEKICPKVEYNE
jgi:hypothetical protein